MPTPSATTQQGPADIVELRGRAHQLRRLMMTMTRGKGEGYIAQGLGVADCLAAIFFHELRHDPSDPTWSDRDRFVLSTGHYSIAMYAALAAAGYLDEDELPTYGLNGSRLPMSTFDDTVGVEIVGGSLGHGLGQAVGMALGLRLDHSSARVFVEISDGELQEGSTWEAAMTGATFGCENVVALVDCNGIQADGPVTVAIEPVADKFTAFGWTALEVDGNDMAALVGALTESREHDAKPKAIIMRTTPGYGVPTLVNRPRAHFVRVADGEWAGLVAELEENHDVRA